MPGGTNRCPLRQPERAQDSAALRVRAHGEALAPARSPALAALVGVRGEVGRVFR